MNYLNTMVSTCLFLVALISSPAFAGFDEGVTAYGKGDYAEATREWFPLAEQGHAAAQFNLGVMYANGSGVPQDDLEATVWYRKAAEQGHAAAQFNLGWKYANGSGVPQNDPEAAAWFLKAAEQGHADAQLKLGELYTNGQGVEQNIKEAIKWYSLASENSDVDALFREKAEKAMNDLIGSDLLKLGEMYAKGLGVQQNYQEAAKWYGLAADGKNNAEAQSILGLMYLQGQGVPQDLIKAASLFRRSAEQGDAEAQSNLGTMYAMGHGVNQDVQEAIKWFRKAAEQRYVWAQYKLGNIYATDPGVNKNYNEAVIWYLKAAEQGNSKAQYELGQVYENGLGVPKNEQEALGWYRKALAQGETKAQERIDAISDIKGVSLLDAKTEVESDWFSFDIQPLKSAMNDWVKSAKKKFGFWGMLLLAIFFIVLISQYFAYRKLKEFIGKASARLFELSREIPEQLTLALSKARLGLVLGFFAITVFVFLWGAGKHAAGLILASILLANIEKWLFGNNRLALRFIESIEKQTKFFNARLILLETGIIEERKGFKKLESLIETKKDKEKAKSRENGANGILVSILACMEAEGKVEVYDLAGDNHFCKVGYLEDFCSEIIDELMADSAKTGIEIKKVVGSVERKSILDKEGAYDLIIGYFKFGKAVVKDGAFSFYTEDQYEELALCDCCGQVVVTVEEDSSSNEIFCSEICGEIYKKLSEEDFVPKETFINASRLIDRGIDSVIVAASTEQYAANQKVFAIGGQGHGFAAEKANTYIDKIKGKDAKIVGDDNAKFGPDREVNGQQIQTKYCKTAARSVGAAFDGQKGNYKYFGPDGKPMPVEVPKDQYDAAVKEIRKAAEKGRIPGVSPGEAEKLVVKGEITYDQAKNIVKFGTIEGLLFDAREAAVAALYGSSISLLLNYSRSYWQTKNPGEAFEIALLSASKAFTKQTTTMILVQQLHRLEFVQNIPAIPIPQSLKPFLARGLNVSQSQVKNALRGMAITNAVVISMSVSIDLFHVLNQTKTYRQFFKNTAVTTAAVTAGSAGVIAGQSIGALFGSVGGPVGAFLGGAILGHLAATATKSFLDKHIEDDKIVVARLVKYQVKYLADQYLMSSEEIQVIADNVVQDAFNFLPSKVVMIEINAVILSHVIYLVKNRPPVRIADFQTALGQTFIGQAEEMPA